MDKHEYLSLFEKHLSGKTSREEEQLLKEYQDDFELLELPWDSDTMGDKTDVRAKLYQRLQENVNPVPVKSLVSKHWYAAAAILLIFSAGLIYTFRINPKDALPQESAKNISKPIRPGGDKAVLTLSDGSEVILDGSETVTAIDEPGASISNKQQGQLVYNTVTAPGNVKAENINNKISTPRGGQYQVILADGTKVWLNASSSLSFPTYFAGTERRVQVTGEAYFEVAKNTEMPFKVEVNGSTIRVLGTHFNVMAYEDEAVTSTTLLEGSVEITKNSKKALLKPGQQAAVANATGVININRVNTDQFVAWKAGKFIFADDGIEEIMRKLSRWYDIDVVYQSENLSDKVFTGTISRFENITEVLRMLELTGTIHFKVSGRRVTVMP